ncbi:hypothetical protein L2E82_45956 [Cichorium intybus]|uniref:Uncharacterized protein n=1 Tax=Cichorium intybus TaxID=13427 RepID=A0ACB8ZTF2_CICIN|nr:hypothetical protein L2E82_45956 [Cichorium intybus]
MSHGVGTNLAKSFDLLERYAAKGHGVITCMASGNDVIVLGTSTGWLIRHDFGVGDSYDIDLSIGRPGEQSIHRVFVDPGGCHCIATVIGVAGSDTYYMHAKWSRPRVLVKLRGLVVNTVAWNRQQITEASTREVILGTDNGQLHEIAVDEKDKREKYVKFLFQLSELPQAFEGLQMETTSSNNRTRYFIMAVTPTRLYSFTGIGMLETIFASYVERAVHFMELPGEIPNSELHYFIKQRRAEHFAWLSGAGIYHGGLNFGAQNRSPNGDVNFVENKALLSYSKLSDGGEDVKPSSIALSEFHFLLLIGNRVKVVNRINEQIVEELQFDQTSETASKGIIGLSIDACAGLFYAYDENSIFQVSVTDEDRDMWKVYLDLKEYAAALANCSDPFQRDQVYLVQAEAAFTDKDYFRAASFFAKINYALSFEEITLKFIGIGEQDALRTFLLRKLDSLVKEDKCQIMMISTWATELYLDKINRLLLEDDSPNNRNSEYQSIIQEFRAFLCDSKDVLDEATTMTLLESYGRVDELVYFASLKEQHEIVIHHYIQQGEAKRALYVLQKPGVSVDLQYKFAPDLVMLDAYETVESWMTRNDLNPRKLIPAMMSYSSEHHAKNETHEVIKYLEYCVHRLQNEDPGVHNLLLSLYAKKEDDSALLRFLQCKFGKGRSNGPDFFYDPKYALRLCLKEKRMRACVHIYSMMFMHEEAVALALQVDPELAMAEADKVEDDEDLRKKLWLMVAKHVVEQEKGTKRENIRKAIAFLKETDGLLKIEDILPFFPDFALIDDFKEAICTSLEDYNQQIEKLKEEMNDATHGADNIRNDISALAQRYAVVDRDEECGVVCRRVILSTGADYRISRGYTTMGPMAPFYVFPCGHAFHAQCLVAHVTKCTDQNQAERILDLQKQLTLMSIEPKEGVNGVLNGDDSITSVAPVDKIRSELDDAIASECPFCGDLMISEVSKPFVLPQESYLASSWDIMSKNVGTEKGISFIV